VSEEAIRADTQWLARETGIDPAPEGGCALAVARAMIADGRMTRDAEVVVFNTGSGSSYRT
jgi:threonine synthase